MHFPPKVAWIFKLAQIIPEFPEIDKGLLDTLDRIYEQREYLPGRMIDGKAGNCFSVASSRIVSRSWTIKEDHNDRYG